MIVTLVSLLLCAAVVALTASPLFRKGGNEPLGRGVEDDHPIRRWQEEKDRLTAQLRENDMALAEGRVDAAAHSSIAARLAADADQALVRLRRAREGLTPVAAETARRIRLPVAAAAAVLVMAATYGVHAFASLGDIDRTRSPHASGEMPVNVAEGGAGMPLGADGAPDIGAMVARLEARINGGDYTPEDAAMLLRSYRTLGRDADARALLPKAIKAFPDDMRLKLTFVETALGGSDPADLAEAKKMVADMLAAQPDLPEARWYHSLFLVMEGDLDAARKELHALEPLVAGIPEAAKAVSSLLARLDIPEHQQLPPK
jgi:cytochrome c-type biogenesis protein CcmH/NrfG